MTPDQRLQALIRMALAFDLPWLVDDLRALVELRAKAAGDGAARALELATIYGEAHQLMQNMRLGGEATVKLDRASKIARLATRLDDVDPAAPAS